LSNTPEASAKYPTQRFDFLDAVPAQAAKRLQFRLQMAGAIN
jgi:hypothetical protein